MNGPFTPHAHSIFVSGPVFRSMFTTTGDYGFTDLPPGNYFVFAQSFFNGFVTGFVHPPSSYSVANRGSVPVTAGTTTIVNVTSNQAFINGILTLRGTARLADSISAFINASGSGVSAGSQSFDLVNRTTGAYDLIVTDGRWAVADLSIDFFKPNPNFLNQHLGFFDMRSFSNSITISAGESVANNVSYEIGSVTISFRVADGRPLSLPRLDGFCQKRDALNRLEWVYSFQSFSSSNQQNVAEGRVTFVGMEGTCTVRPFALVGGSLTQFGEFIVNAVPGAQQLISIGGPTLHVAFPEPDFLTSNASITVTGLATDDVTVGGVTVNGIQATLASTNNPNDPAEVAFTATINLNRGSNEIVTIATDNAGKISSDTRTVYRDEDLPILNWTPANGSVSSTTSITVRGVATDDAGIDSITVNGRLVSFQSNGNPNDPNEMSFNVPFTLAESDNFITVVATDISTKSTSQTHRVIYVPDATPPVIVPIVSPAPNTAGWNNTAVTVSWNVKDPESDIVFSSGCATTNLATETVGTTVTCSATNGAGLSSSVSVIVKIDKTPPNAPIVNVNPTPNAAGWNNSTPVTVRFASNGDAGKVQSGVARCTSPNSLFSEAAGTLVTGTCTDIAGNLSAGTSASVKIDVTPPTTTATISPAPNSQGWNNSNVSVTLTPADNLSGIAKTEFNLNSAGWVVYTGPISISAEGIHTLLFRSRDKADNIESPRSLTIRVDKTPPELTARCAPPGKSPFLIGRESLSGIASVTLTGSSAIRQGKFKRRETHAILDQAGNRLEATFGVKAEGHEVEFVLLRLAYNGAPPITVTENEFKCEWAFDKSGVLKELEQKLEIEGSRTEVEVQAKFRGNKKQTEIKVKNRGVDSDQRVTRPGVVFLNLTTNRGDLGVDF